ncbi:MAG: hypothetical protein AUF65_01010 [Chloroflexi bacterium 13_1_20CM_50_12]|nr:MAG: hypothetical protein AUF65_01010 [Chloroflexi bacterium 13_1_20CM_50_12]
MSIQFSQGKLQDQERKTILQAVQSHMQTAAQEAVRGVVTEVVEAEVTAKLGREKGQPREAKSQVRESDWKCAHCGCSDANQFIRDGHYRRELQTGWGTVQNLQVPMLECQRCKHDVICNYAILEKHQRFWMDLTQDALWSSGCGQSLRDIRERWSATIGSSIGLRTINERINQIEPLVHQFHHTPFRSPQLTLIDLSPNEWVLYWRTPAYAPARRKRQVPGIIQLPLFDVPIQQKAAGANGEDHITPPPSLSACYPQIIQRARAIRLQEAGEESEQKNLTSFLLFCALNRFQKYAHFTHFT